MLAYEHQGFYAGGSWNFR